MARNKRADQQTNMPAHPDIPFNEASLGVDTPQAKPNTPDYAAQLAELSANLKRLEEANSTLQRTNLALMGQGVQTQQPNFGPAQMDLNNLPDPVTEPQRYAAEIVSRGDAVLQARQKEANWRQQQQLDLQEKVDGIWEQFGESYPGYASNTDLVEAAASKAVAKARQQGIDPNRYMFAATPQFFADTIGILNAWGIKPASEAEDAVEEEKQPEPLRTAGIPGGLESSGKVAPGKEEEQAAMPSLMDELRDWKTKGGWY